MRLVFGEEQRPIDVNQIDHLDRPPVVFHRQRDLVQPGSQVDVVRAGKRAGLAVAKVPKRLPLHGEAPGRGVAKHHAQHRQRVVRQRHLAGNLHQEIGNQPGGRVVTRPAGRWATR